MTVHPTIGDVDDAAVAVPLLGYKHAPRTRGLAMPTYMYRLTERRHSVSGGVRFRDKTQRPITIKYMQK